MTEETIERLARWASDGRSQKHTERVIKEAMAEGLRWAAHRVATLTVRSHDPLRLMHDATAKINFKADQMEGKA